jgi:Subtilase family
VVQPLASLSVFTSDNVYTSADDQVIGFEGDRNEQFILDAEVGPVPPDFTVAVQQGIVVSDLTGSPAANAAVQKAQAPKASTPASRPTSLSLADSAATDARIATAQPAAQVEIHGYTASGTPELTTPAPAGYSPALVQSYLGLHGDGAGQTVAVVDAPGNPDIAADVDQFSQQFGLPQVCSSVVTTGCFDFTVDTPDGTGTVDPGWGLETSLDIEWIHAIAPRASIVLVESADAGLASMFKAVAAAAQLKPDAISMSWGESGEFTDETYYDHFCRLADSLCVVSAGDYGFPGSYPAYNPSVLAIGGTSLQLGSDGSVVSETAWSDGGGGQSYVEPTPAYQDGVAAGGRGTPDVSFDADPATGVAIYDSTPDNGQSGWFQVGGTSVGAPVWSAILATTDQLRAATGTAPLNTATAHQAVYGSTSALGDVVSGSNGQCPVCTAGTGYDFVTGLGSPRNGLDATLAATR